MRKLILTSLLLLPAISHAEVCRIEGTYQCQCVEVETKVVYNGHMIINKTGKTYEIESKFNDGSFYKSTGIYDMTKHQLALAFFNPKLPNESGVALVNVNNDCSMHSTWTYLGKASVGTGTCHKVVK